MDVNGWSCFEGKKVYLVLKGGRVYVGRITLVENCGNGLVFLHLLDKFNKNVVFTSGEIASMKEEAY